LSDQFSSQTVLPSLLIRQLQAHFYGSVYEPLVAAIGKGWMF